MVNVLDSEIIVCEFDLKRRFYVLFRINMHEKGINSLSVEVPVV